LDNVFVLMKLKDRLGAILQLVTSIKIDLNKLTQLFNKL